MKVVLLTCVISPHQLPLAKELVRLLGKENYSYIYTTHISDDGLEERKWFDGAQLSYCRKGTVKDPELLAADVLLSGERACDLFEKRIYQKKMTYYLFERWFKPPLGISRLLHPKYLTMAWRIYRCTKSSYFKLLPIGIHAARDIARLMGLFDGDLRCLFYAPKVTFESKPVGKIWINGKLSDKMRMWGYFVECSTTTEPHAPPHKPLKVLWVGRMLDWKRVDTLVKACKELEGVELSLYGKGPEEPNLRKIAEGCDNITFHGFVPITHVRQLMREHDIYVLPSNDYEGWGAVVSEALEEGMKALGTLAAGSSSTILPPANLFHVGDIKRLRTLLQNDIAFVKHENWSARTAAEALLKIIQEFSS